MALADPQSITISGVTTSLPRVKQERTGASYSSPDGLIVLSAAHTENRRARRVLRIDHSKVTADPFLPAQNVKVSMSNYMVFDVPPAGYTVAEILAVYTGFKSAFSASSDALISHLLGGES